MEIEAVTKPQGNVMIVDVPELRVRVSPWDKEMTGGVGATLVWKELTVTVALKNGEAQNLLEGISGYAEPGSLMALMGPSGSGKSTLLDALSCRLAANAFLSGTVLLNGRKANLSFGTAVSVYIV